jgi:TonB-linked SusC/RagA family outer membrane protein
MYSCCQTHKILVRAMTSSAARSHRSIDKNIKLAMKITVIIILTACMAASAKGNAQIILSQKDVPLQTVLKEIQKQSGYDIVFTYEMVQRFNKVSVNLRNASLEQALNEALKNTNLSYSIVGKIVAIKLQSPKENATNEQPSLPVTVDISGKITNDEGSPLEGANVKVKGTDKGTTTNSDGVFVLKGVDENAILEISFVGYQTITVQINSRTSISATLQLNVLSAPEVIVRKGYYNEKRTTTTGNVSSITVKDIEKQPVNNVLLSLAGRIPGMTIVQQNGLPGSALSIRIRGQNSIYSGSDPLYIIDGVPYTTNNLASVNSVLGYGSSGNGSPFSFINPADIEAIDVLKDADATAIYGSRGANGVVLITTKKGRAGQMRVNVNIQSGIGKVARKLNVLNTRQYLDMRYEALKNDGVSLSSLTQDGSNYDLTIWDTTRYTDWQKELIGGTANYNDIQASLLGGNENTQFLIGTGYHKETTIFPGDLSDQKASVHFSISSTSTDKKFSAQLSGSYLADNNNIISYDLTETAVKLAPNAPAIYDSDGSLNWALNSAGNSTWSFTHPLSRLLTKFKSRTNNLVSNAILSYKILKGLEVKSSFGYTNMQTDEVQTIPLVSFAPALRSSAQRLSYFGDNDIRSWIIEPQMNYSLTTKKGVLNALIGTSFQKINSNRQQLNARGFNSDLVLEDIKAATSVTVAATLNAVYKYNALFGRFNYNWEEKYLLNLTARRDGSSRFGPANRFHNFDSAGLGWVFSKEKFTERIFNVLSFGKLRVSYGTTGSDQVGDYSFMDLYTSNNVGVPYQGATGNIPSRIYTPDLAWEETKKLEIGIELGFFQDRLNPSISFYRNRSSNQIVDYSLPAITGFTSIRKNLDALVENKGWEFEVKSVTVEKKFFKWSSFGNLTINRNKLLSGSPGLSAVLQERIGYPLLSFWVYHFTGVDPITGLYTVADVQGHNTTRPNPLSDKTILIDLSPQFYGGIQNSFEYRGFQLDFLFSFVKQKGTQYLYNYIPGLFSTNTFGANQPVSVLKHWQTPGDVSNIQRFNSNYMVLNSFLNAQESDQQYGDASYVRLKNASLSWQFPKQWKQRLQTQNAKIYIQGQNLLTITNYKGLDPETNGFIVLPPLRVITAGIQLIF